jgi:hypothetical protein
VDIQALKIDDWSGGITDHYVNGPLNRSQRLNNFLISRNRKPVERPGSELYDNEFYQIPAGNSRIGKIVYFDSILFQQSARNVYFISGGIHLLDLLVAIRCLAPELLVVRSPLLSGISISL